MHWLTYRTAQASGGGNLSVEIATGYTLFGFEAGAELAGCSQRSVPAGATLMIHIGDAAALDPRCIVGRIANAAGVICRVAGMAVGSAGTAVL